MRLQALLTFYLVSLELELMMFESELFTETN